MKKGTLLYLTILVIQGVCFFMGMGFILLMYRVFGPLVPWVWLLGLGWVVIFSLVSFFPIRDLFVKIKE